MVRRILLQFSAYFRFGRLAKQVTCAYFDQFAMTETSRVIDHADDDRNKLDEDNLARLGGR